MRFTVIAADLQAIYAAHRAAWKVAYRVLYDLPPEKVTRGPDNPQRKSDMAQDPLTYPRTASARYLERWVGHRAYTAWALKSLILSHRPAPWKLILHEYPIGCVQIAFEGGLSARTKDAVDYHRQIGTLIIHHDSVKALIDDLGKRIDDFERRRVRSLAAPA
jgi:hypothetical protein